MTRAIRFAIFGDSICVGQHVSPPRTWAVRLAARIEAALAPRPVVVLNPSINGDTTRKALERMPYDIQASGVDAILIQFGLNDSNRWQTDGGVPRVSEAAFAANLREIVARARAFGAGPVLMNTNHPTTRDNTPLPHSDVTQEDCNRRYNDIIRTVAREDGEVVLTDMEAIFHRLVAGGAGLASLLLPDGLHLSEAGHDAYLETLTEPAISAAKALRG